MDEASKSTVNNGFSVDITTMSFPLKGASRMYEFLDVFPKGEKQILSTQMMLSIVLVMEIFSIRAIGFIWKLEVED